MSASTNGTTLEYSNRVETKEPTNTKEPITRLPAKGKKSRVRWLALPVVILGVIAGVSYWLYSSQFEDTDDAYVTGHEHPVSFRVAGTSSEVLVDDNQLVKQGQPVAQLDPKGGNDRVASKDSSFRLHSFDYLDTTLIPYFLRKIGRFFSFHSIGSLTVNF